MRKRSLLPWHRAGLLAALWLSVAPGARAQTMGATRSLAGYGGAWSSSASGGMGGQNPAVPYAGTFGGFMPYRMANSGGPLSAASPGASGMGMGAARTPFRMSSMQNAPFAGMTPAFLMRSSSQGSFGISGAPGLGRGMRPALSPGMGTGVMPPSLAYPFYQPPGLPGAISPGAGMPIM